MRHANWLFYQKKQSKQRLTSRETGHIDLDAYLNNASKFFIDDEAVQLIPKKIILRQIHLKQVDLMTRLKFYLVLNELVQKGFEVCTPKDGYLKKENLNAITRMLFHHELDTSLVEPNFPPSEQFFILDDLKVQEIADLFNGFHPEIPINFEILHHYLKNKLSFVVDSDDEDEDIESQREVSQLLDEAHIIAPHLLELMPDNPSYRWLQQFDWEQINEDTSLDDLNRYLNAFEIENLRIDLSYNMNTEQIHLINKIISKNHVKNFEFDGDTSLLNQLKIKLNKLEEVSSFEYAPERIFDEKNLFEFNVLPKKINTLFLENVKLCIESFEKKLIDRAILKRIEFDENSLITILNQIPDIQSIQFEELNIRNCESLNLLNSLVHLKQLEIKFMTFSKPVLTQILENSPNLEYLEIMINPTSTISYLSKLKIANFHVNNDIGQQFDLHQLLTQMPSLQELQFLWHDETVLSMPLTMTSGLCLPELKTIHVSQLSSDQLRYLLKVAPNLETLMINRLPGDFLIPARIKVELTKYYISSNSIRFDPSPPKHRPEEMLDYSPPKKTYEFKNFNTSFNQGMVIDKLCRYLEIHKSIPLETLNRLQLGICDSLANFLLTYHYVHTQQFLHEAKNWNGEIESLSEKLSDNFDNLYSIVISDYIQKNHKIEHFIFIGMNHECILEKENSLKLSNPWHAISVQKKGIDWIFYDPNHLLGPVLCKNKQELLKNIQASLGELVSISTQKPDLYNDIQVTINNIPQFLESGGFLILDLLNQALYSSIIHLLEAKKIPAIILCNALKMTDNEGNKAWQKLPKELIPIIIDTYLDDECPRQAQELLIDIQNHQTPKDDNQPQQATNPSSLFYKKINAKFSSWKASLKHAPSPILQYLQSLMHEEKTLIKTSNQSILLSLRNGIQKTACALSKPIYYVDKAEDLQLISKRLRLQSDGKVKIEIGSPLSDFVNENTGSKKLILINYDNFSTEDIIAFNEILNEVQQINGVFLGQGVQIIGLQNLARQDAYQESDFYSRFNKVEYFEFPETALDAYKIVLEMKPSQDDTNLGIQIFDSTSWKEILFGRFIIHGNDFKFEPGAITTKTLPETLILQNAPYEDAQFYEFWRQASITGKILIHGVEYTVPERFQIIHQSGYVWENLKRSLTSEEISPPQFILTSYNLTQYIGGQKIENGQIVYLEGLLQSPEPKRLSILLTQELSDGQWARLLSANQGTNNLEIYALPKIIVPDALKPLIKPYQQENLEIIQTNDVEQYLEQYPITGFTVDVSEIESAELFDYVKPIQGVSDGYYFESKPSWLLEKLMQENKVTLKGYFSERLIQAIAAYILLHPELSKNLRLVSDIKSSIDNFNPRFVHYPSPKTLTKAEQASLDLLNAPSIPILIRDLDSDTLTSERISKITDALVDEPCIFITGLSGCGKTTFIKKHFSPYLEKEGIRDWIASNHEPSYLFFDEANLGDNHWLIFEGLYQTPPYIFYEGEYHLLSSTHKVIFAGNPIAYGDERTLPKLFTNHPNVVVFDPLPPKALANEVLNPLLKNTPLATYSKDIFAPILDVYQTLLSYSKDKMIISPRELQTMVMLTLSDYQKNPTQHPLVIARYYAYTIGRQLVPTTYQAKFDEKFKIEKPSVIFASSDDFLITESRQSASKYLRDLLTLRSFRRETSALSQEQKTAGLGGVIIEGEPGIGKSELLIKILTQEFNFQKATENTSNATNVFYMIPPNISITERKALLLEAFHKGAVVIIDEMNSGPMLESCLNALLMGKTPAGEIAREPGFTVLATQNPSTRSGRRTQSDALLRRMIKFNLSNYSAKELVEILKSKKFDEKTAIIVANIFLERQQYAKHHGLKPEPNFRDLMRFSQDVKNQREITHFFSRAFEFKEYHQHLRKFFTLELSSEELLYLIQNIEILKPIPNDEIPTLHFLNHLNENHIAILRAYIEHTDIQEAILHKIKNQCLKKEVLSWWIDKQKNINEIILKEIQKYSEPKFQQATLAWDLEHHKQIHFSSHVLRLIFDSPALQAKILQIRKKNFLQQQKTKDAEKLYTAVSCNYQATNQILSYHEFLSVLYFKSIVYSPDEIKQWLDAIEVNNHSEIPQDIHEMLMDIIRNLQAKDQTDLNKDIFIKFKGNINKIANKNTLFGFLQKEFPEMLQEMQIDSLQLFLNVLNGESFNLKLVLEYLAKYPIHISYLIPKLNTLHLLQIKNEEIFKTNAPFRLKLLENLNHAENLGRKFLNAAKNYSDDSEKYLAIHTHIINIHVQISLFKTAPTETRNQAHLEQISRLTEEFIKEYQNPMGIKEYILNAMLLIGAVFTLGILLYFIPFYTAENPLSQAAKEIEERFKP